VARTRCSRALSPDNGEDAAAALPGVATPGAAAGSHTTPLPPPAACPAARAAAN
jgi:hypothetical protein